MNTESFTTIKFTPTLAEADVLIAALQSAGLHPVELGTTDHVSVAGTDYSFPVKVPVEEADAARELLGSQSL